MRVKNSIMKNLQVVWKGWCCSILVAVLIATSFKSAIADWNVVPTGSMKPTIVEGDRILVNKLAYDLKVPYTTWRIAEWATPLRGEIVVFNSPADGKRLVKRIVGIPGDLIEMRNNQLILNGEKVKYEPPNRENPLLTDESDKYVFMENLSSTEHPVMFTPHWPALRSFRPMTVPEGMYFMMGDNRDNSADSRYFGFVERGRIVGKATSIIASIDIDNFFNPRWERFFTALP